MPATEPLECDVVVIGAGVVGLAIARTLAEKHSVILLDRHSKFGQETSSRNSEVVHSGIYYPVKSRKEAWCIEGRMELYAFCETFKIPYGKCGKYVIATSEPEEAYLDKLSKHCTEIGVAHLRMGSEEIAKAEPLVAARSGIYFPESGIVDSHSVMGRLEQLFLASDGMIAYGHLVKHISADGKGWNLSIQNAESTFKIKSSLVVNSAGLGAAALSNIALETDKYEHRYCRGRYFSLSGKFQNKFKHLIYPVPPKDGLGVHVTLDLNGGARLGPDVDWCPGVSYEKSDSLYDCDWETLRVPFLAAAKKYLPSLKEQDLAPGLIGIRPKLFLNGTAHPDFLVENHSGFIHCLGIESPGLTASLAIAKEVKRLVLH